jgi:hypothetical protein
VLFFRCFFYFVVWSCFLFYIQYNINFQQARIILRSIRKTFFEYNEISNWTWNWVKKKNHENWGISQDLNTVLTWNDFYFTFIMFENENEMLLSLQQNFIFIFFRFKFTNIMITYLFSMIWNFYSRVQA